MRALAARVARGVVGRARARLARRGAVLLYHRVADLGRDPWNLAVSPRRFEAHMAALARGGYSPLPLGDFVDALGAGRLPRRAVAVTFDDAYGDVGRTALPILERHGVPATAFAVSGAVGRAREFWWDALERLVLDAGALPAELDLGAAAAPFAVPADARGRAAAAAPAVKAWRAWTGAHPTPRHALYHALWRHLQPLDAPARAAALDALDAQLDAPPAAPDAFPMTADALRQFARSAVGTVGAHTVTHPSLAAHTVDDQAREVAGSRRELEQLLGGRVDLFAYPFGDRKAYTADTVRLVAEAGFRAACVNEPAPVRPGADPLRLPRLYVSDWGEAEFRLEVEVLLRS